MKEDCLKDRLESPFQCGCDDCVKQRSSSAPACSTALIIEAGDYELQDDNPDVIWLYHSTGEGLAIPRDEFADYLDALFKQRF